MSELTAAEKRQLLRERRAAKMATASSSRLNKIMGTSGSSVHEPISEQPVSATTETTTTAASTSEKPEPHKSNRISKTFEPVMHDDPPVPSLADLDQEIPDPLHGAKELSMDDILNKFLQGHQDSSHSEGSGPLPDDFMKTIGSLLGNMGDGSGFQPTSIEGSSQVQEEAPVTGGMSLDVKQQYKEIFDLIRYFAVTIIFYITCVGNDSCSVILASSDMHLKATWNLVSWWKSYDSAFISSGCSLWSYFLTLQCIFSATQLFLANGGYLPHRSRDSWVGVVLNLIPATYKTPISMAVNYLDIVVGFWRDFCLLLVLLVLKALFVKYIQ